jgi:hydroxylysine kinase
MLDPLPRLCFPTISCQTASLIGLDLYGVEGEATAIRGEREQIFQIGSDSAPQYILRIADDRESQDALDFQNRILLHLEQQQLDINVPRVFLSRRSKHIECLTLEGTPYRVRLLSYVPGIQIERTTASPILLHEVGTALARLDLALADADCASQTPALIWRMEESIRLTRYADFVPTAYCRSKVVDVLDEFDNQSLPRFANLRSQVIHNDFNPRNVLISFFQQDRVCGVIDFGDLTKSALVVDLAVAAARHASFPDPLSSIKAIIEGYERVLPLTGDERQILFNLICVRLAMVILIWSWRRVTYGLEEARGTTETAERMLEYLLSWRSSNPNKGTSSLFGA